MMMVKPVFFCLMRLGWLTAFAWGALTGHVAAQGSAIAMDSEIQLIEQSDEGAYRSRAIMMTTRDQKTTITIVQDDQKSEAMMPFDDYAALWRFALALDVVSLEDAPLENAYPGQSQFDFVFRDGSTTHEFSAYGVDFLTDSRYRELAREIIRVAELQFSSP